MALKPREFRRSRERGSGRVKDWVTRITQNRSLINQGLPTSWEFRDDKRIPQYGSDEPFFSPLHEGGAPCSDAVLGGLELKMHFRLFSVGPRRSPPTKLSLPTVPVCISSRLRSRWRAGSCLGCFLRGKC